MGGVPSIPTLTAVRHGEEVTDHGKAVARLVPLDAPGSSTG